MPNNLLLEPPQDDSLREAHKNDYKLLAKNSIYVEFLGMGPFLLINYDRILQNKPKWNLIGRIGIIGWNEDQPRPWERTRTLVSSLTVLMPLKEKIIFNKHKKYIEMGIGHSSVWKGDSRGMSGRSRLLKSPYSAFYTLNFGIRRQPIKRGITLRAVFTILILTKPVDIFWDTYRLSILPWGGLSIGYAF